MTDSTQSAAPTISPTEAQGRLDALATDPAWVGKFFAGDVEARQQFGDLTAAAALRDDHANALADEPAPDPEFKVYAQDELTARDLAGVIQDFRLQGISDAAISDLLSGKSASKQEYISVQKLQHMKFGDAEWVKRYLAGGAAERREATLMAMIVTAFEGPR